MIKVGYHWSGRGSDSPEAVASLVDVFRRPSGLVILAGMTYTPETDIYIDGNINLRR